MIEPKGIDKYCAYDYNDYIFITNNDWIVKVTMSDRRYCCIEVSQKYVGNMHILMILLNLALMMKLEKENFLCIC